MYILAEVGCRNRTFWKTSVRWRIALLDSFNRSAMEASYLMVI
jgi:hypothetical protein